MMITTDCAGGSRPGERISRDHAYKMPEPIQLGELFGVVGVREEKDEKGRGS